MITLVVQQGIEVDGVWCPKCLLPSIIETPIYFIFTTGVTKLSKPFRRCTSGCKCQE